jgi:predicted permease
MDWHARIRQALTSADERPDEDVVEELAQYARAVYERARADGGDHVDAERRVTAQIETWRAESAALRPRTRRQAAVVPPPAATSSWLQGIAQDFRYACRLIRRQPRFALLVVLTMGLGIGPTTALFSVAQGVLMTPWPWAAADRLVVLKETRGGRTPRFGSFSNATYLAWREHTTALEDVGAWRGQTFTLTGAGDPERVRVTTATASLFRVLAVRPIAGSLFDEHSEREKVVVLSESLWRQRFGRDPEIVGRSIQFDGEPYTILGVLPDEVGYPDRLSRAWVPFSVPAPTGNLLSMFEVLARRRPEATIEQVAAEGAARGSFAADTGMTTVAIFGGDGPVGVDVRPLGDALLGDVRRPLIVLLFAVTLLLAIATTNVASLQLARATTRRRELAIRSALGAATGRVMRQLVLENLLLGAAGGAVGLAAAWGLYRAAVAILPADFPRVLELAFDGRVVLFTVVTSVLTSLVFGWLPALRLRRLDVVASLAEDGASPAGFGRRVGVARSRLVIVAGQVAIACILLVGASLLGRSFLQLLRADRGYDPAHVLTAPLSMSGPGYTPERRIAVLEALLDRLGAVPTVRGVAFTSESPLTPGGSTSSLTLPARDGGAPVAVQASPRLVSPGYFATLGLRVVAGRGLEDSDVRTSEPVAVVNETFVRRYLGGSALGVKIPMGVWGRAQSGDATIVGVVEDVRYVGAPVLSLPEMYFSYRQVNVGLRSSIATLLLRDDGRLESIAGGLRSAVRSIDPALAPGALMTLEDRLLSTSLARPRLYAALLSGFAVLALAVTGVGLFGVLSYTVAQRTRELALRAALGARRRDLVSLVVRQGLGVALIGIAAGLVTSIWLATFVATLLYGVDPSDPATYLGVPLVLLAVATAACIVPALRAARLDPVRALRP